VNTSVKELNFVTPIIATCIDGKNKEFQTIVYYDMKNKKSFSFDENLTKEDLKALSEKLKQSFQIPLFNIEEDSNDIMKSQRFIQATLNKTMDGNDDLRKF
jgi:hypothetical protein